MEVVSPTSFRTWKKKIPSFSTFKEALCVRNAMNFDLCSVPEVTENSYGISLSLSGIVQMEL